MTANDKLTSLADKYRSAFNTEDKFSLDDTKPEGFVRVNSDHQAMNFQIKDIKLYKR